MGDWRAILICGHRQHIRHNPPLVSRPWVLTEEGRSRFLGVALDCKACDEGEPVSDAMVLPDALEAIYTQFHTDLHRFILSRVSDPGTAEAILQYVYLMIHAHAGDRRESDRLANWLYEIVRNAIIDYGHALPEVNAPSGAAELAPAVRAFPGLPAGKRPTGAYHDRVPGPGGSGDRRTAGHLPGGGRVACPGRARDGARGAVRLVSLGG